MAGDLDALATPVVVVDLAVVERNIAAMAAHAARLGVALRPHAKTHKSVALAARQLAAGAAGLTVATLGEAEVFADAGCPDLFVAYPLWVDAARAGRLAALAERARLRIGVDSAEAAAAIGRAVAPRGAQVLVEVDSGHHRSGVAPSAVRPVADAAARAGLEVVGAFTFPGHGYGPGKVAQAVADESRALAAAADELRAGGLEVSVLSGGSTPTVTSTDATVVGEVRPGVYVFNDAQQLTLGTCRMEDVGLSVLSTVTSSPGPDRVVLDAGSKVLSSDRPPWLTGFGLLPDAPEATIASLAEHHGVVSLAAVEEAAVEEAAGARARLAVGSRVRVVPNHVCSVVNLVDELVVVHGDDVVDVWPVDARGRNT